MTTDERGTTPFSTWPQESGPLSGPVAAVPSPLPTQGAHAVAPEAAPEPARKGPRALAGDLKKALDRIEPFALASQLAYSLIFALPSLILVIVLLAVAVDRRTGVSPLAELQQALEDGVPESLREPLTGLIATAIQRASEPAPTLSALSTALVALWAAGGGVEALSRACTRASGDKDPRPAWLRRVLSVFVALLLALLLVVVFVILVFGESFWLSATSWLFGVPLGDGGLRLLRIGVGLVLVFLFLLILYRASLGREWSFSHLAIGSAVATVLWFAATEVFQIYLRISDPGSAYGAASSALVLLSFLWVSSLILIVGAMVSAVLRHREVIVRDRVALLRRGGHGADATAEAAPPVSREPAGWRRALTPVLVIVWGVLAPLALLAVWAHGVILDTPRYVATVDRVADDPAVQRLVAEAVANDLVGRPAGSPDATADEGLWASALQASQRALAEEMLPAATESVLASDTFKTVWHEANDRAHRQLLRVIDGDDPGPVALEVDPAAFLPDVEAALKSYGVDLPASLPMPTAPVSITLLTTEDLATLRGRAALLDDLARWLPIAAGAALLLALLVAPARRSALKGALFAAGVAMAVLLLLLLFGPSLVIGPTGGDLVKEALSTITEEVLQPIRVVALVLALVGIVAGMLVPRSTRSGGRAAVAA